MNGTVRAPRAHRRVALVCTLVGAVLACGRAGEGDRPSRRDGDAPQTTAAACDSARAARTALDSLAQLNRFRSKVHRYTADSAGARIVTVPAQGERPLDGMAIVHVDGACRIAGLVQTDSA